MGYLYDQMVKALGGERLLGRQDMEYGNWTPNGVRTVGLFRDLIIIEYHPCYNKGKIYTVPLKLSEVHNEVSKGSRIKNPFTVFQHKKFMTIEEVIIDGQLELDTSPILGRGTDEKSRLREVNTVQWSQDMSKAFISRVATKRKENPDSTLARAFGMSIMNAEPGPGYNDWYARYSLTPKVYKSDIKGGPLDKYFSEVAERHGVSSLEQDPTEGKKALSSLEIDNIKQHRINVAADTAKVDSIKAILSEIKRLKNVQGGGDSDGAEVLSKSLRKVLGRTDKPLKGLKYYLETYEDKDSINEFLSKFYSKYGYVDEKEGPSRVSIGEVNGYIEDINEGIVKSIKSVYKSREHRKLYVPDTDRYIPSLETLPVFVDLLVGNEFDYVGYSAELEEIANGGEDVELAEKVRKRLEEAEQSDEKPVVETAQIIKKSLNEDKDARNAEFYDKVRKGAVSAGRDVYIHHGSTALSDAANNHLPWVQKTVAKGLSVLASKKTPWGFVLAPFIDKVVGEGGEALLDTLNQLFDELDRFLEGERDGRTELTEDREVALSGLFEDVIYGSRGVELLNRFVSDAINFSTLKKRQISRMARSKTGIAGLEKFLEKHSDEYGESALAFYKKWDYFQVVDGQQEKGIDTRFNKLLNPEEFYNKVYDDFASLQYRTKKLVSKKRADAVEGIEKLYELDAICRNVLGLQSRQYGGYSPRFVKGW